MPLCGAEVARMLPELSRKSVPEDAKAPAADNPPRSKPTGVLENDDVVLLVVDPVVPVVDVVVPVVAVVLPVVPVPVLERRDPGIPAPIAE